MSEDHEHPAIRFLRGLRPDGGATFVVAFDPEGGGPKDSQLFEPSTYHQLPGWLERENEKHKRNIYFSINSVRPDFEAGGNAQVKDKDIARVEFLQADFDVPKNPNAHKRTPDQREADWERRLAEMLGKLGEWTKAGWLPLASAAWSSGGGKWLLWRLTEPLPMSPEMRDRVREANQQIEAAFRPWVDKNCVNTGRIARFPGTINYPNGDKRAQGRKAAKAGLPAFSPETYDFESFVRRLPSSSAPREGEPVERRPAAPGFGTPGGGPPAPVRGANLPEWAKAHPLLKAGEVEPIQPGLDPWDVFEPYGLSPNVLRIIAGGSQGLDPEEREARAERGTDMSPSGWVFPIWCEFARRGVPFALAVAATEVEDWGLFKYRHRPAGAKRKRITREHLLSEFRNAVADCINKGDLRSPDTPPPDPRGALDWMNARHAVIEVDGANCLVASWVPSDLAAGRTEIKMQSFTALRERYANRRVETADADGNIKLAPLGKWWLEHPARRQFLNIVFRPGEAPQIGRSYNLWQGFGIDPPPGDWSLMQGHIREVLAGGNEEAEDYILRWAAYAVQQLRGPQGVILAFRGSKGSGKGTFARALADLFGQHGLHVASSSLLTGRFNGHLEDCCLLFADEAISPGDREAESRLKALTTEPTLTLEAKGRDARAAANHLKIVMASNSEWVAPASWDERRYAVFDVSDSRKGDKAYFDALNRELRNGGLAAMLYDLLDRDLGDWRPEHAIPTTEALAHQKDLSLPPEEAWLLAILEAGELPGEWPDGFPPYCRPSVWRLGTEGGLLDHMHRYSPRLRQLSPQKLGRFLGQWLDRCGPYAGTRGWRFPPLADLRAKWQAKHGPRDWPEGIDEWPREGFEREEANRDLPF